MDKLTPTQEREKIIRDKLYTHEYMNKKKAYIVTTRFNDATWEENVNFRARQSNKLGCIYCSPILISSSIPPNSPIFVLEMNNDTDKIIGIGMVRNHPYTNYCSVYKNNNFNRYVYTGKYRIDRSDISEEDDKILQAFDILCFKGSRHMKRGHGITSFPPDMLSRCARTKMDLVDYISNMFKHAINTKQHQEI